MSQADCRLVCKCRPGRPNCRRARAKWDKPCRCDGYHYPHRIGSALCEHGKQAQAKRNAIMYGPEKKAANG